MKSALWANPTYAAKIEHLLESFVPLEKRSWYPWKWPDKNWWKYTDKREINKYIEKVRTLATEDFFFFCDEILRNSEDPHLHEVHAVICHLLQNTDSDIGQLLPRNHLKSTITSVGFPLWKLALDPNLRFMIASDTLRVAKKFIKAHKAHLTSNKKLQIIFPNLKPAVAPGMARFQCWTNSEIEVERTKIGLGEPSITSISVGTDFTGMHYDIHIYDDIVTQKSVEREGGLTHISEWYEQSLNLLDRGGRLFVVGTRYIDGDLYGDLIDRNAMPFYIRSVIEDGRYIWDDPLNISRVEKMRNSMSAYMFSCQYMNDPIVKGDQVFEPDWIKKWNANVIRRELFEKEIDDDLELITAWQKSLDIYMGCDPARTDKKRSDYTVHLVKGVDTRGREFALDFIREKLKLHDIVDQFIKMFVKWKPKSAGIETYGGDIHVYTAVIKTMKEMKLEYWRVFEYDKNLRMSGHDRIRALEMPYAHGMMYIGEGAKWAEYEYELLRFPYAKHDDIITTDAYIHSQQAKPKKEYKPVEKLRGWKARQLGGSRTNTRGSWMV